VIDSLKGIEYTLRPAIYQVQEDEEDEISEIVEQGKLMLTAIQYGTDELKEQIQNTLLPYVEKQRNRDEGKK
jgi:CHASE3 domain sensor protein